MMTMSPPEEVEKAFLKEGRDGLSAAMSPGERNGLL